MSSRMKWRICNGWCRVRTKLSRLSLRTKLISLKSKRASFGHLKMWMMREKVSQVSLRKKGIFIAWMLLPTDNQLYSRTTRS
jgi:hypothetical protein